MKKVVSLLVGAMLCSSIFGQLNVYDNGNVGVNTESSLSKVSVGNEGNSLYYFNIYCPLEAKSSQGLRVQIVPKAYVRYGIVGATEGGVGYGRGIYGSVYKSTPTGSGRAYGVVGVAGNSTSGYNYGLYGNLTGSNNGTGVFGTTDGRDAAIDGKYAGYFNGNVKITGNAWVNGSTVVTSDIRAKNDIRKLDKGNTAKLKSLNGLKYKLKNPNAQALSAKAMRASSQDTGKVERNSPELEEVYNKDRIGLSAQEVQKVFPELVVEAQDGTLGVDYIGMIPVLIEAIKEQQIEIESLKRQMHKKGKK